MNWELIDGKENRGGGNFKGRDCLTDTPLWGSLSYSGRSARWRRHWASALGSIRRVVPIRIAGIMPASM